MNQTPRRPICLDHLRAAHADAPLFGNNKPGAAASNDAAAAKAASTPADEPDNGKALEPRFHDSAGDFADGQLAGIGFLQPDAAGVKQDQRIPPRHQGGA